MVLKINKSDYERLIGALEVAKDLETNANRENDITISQEKDSTDNMKYFSKKIRNEHGEFDSKQS